MKPDASAGPACVVNASGRKVTEEPDVSEVIVEAAQPAHFEPIHPIGHERKRRLATSVEKNGANPAGFRRRDLPAPKVSATLISHFF
jgi:hypothetical protein